MHLPALLLDWSQEEVDVRAVVRMLVGHREDEIDVLRHCLREDAGTDLVAKTAEGLGPKAEKGNNGIDALMVVPELDTGEPRQLSGYSQLPDARRAVDEDQLHCGIVSTRRC